MSVKRERAFNARGQPDVVHCALRLLLTALTHLCAPVALLRLAKQRDRVLGAALPRRLGLPPRHDH